MLAEKERLEIRISAPMLAELRQEAHRRGLPIAELVRRSIDAFLQHDREERHRAAENLFQVGAPVGEWEEMKREISAAYAKSLTDA